MNEVAKKDEGATVHEAEIVEVQPQTITPHNQDNSIEGFISAAIEAKLPIETIKEFLVMRKELKADQAKEAFTEAMANFQKDCPVIAKTSPVKSKTGEVTYRFASIDSIILQVKDVLGKNKLAYKFREERNKEEGTVTVYCVVTHAMGHSEETPFTVEIGTEAYMTDVQKFGARNTFAKRYAFCNAFGIVTGNEDTDAKEILSPEDKKQAAADAIQNMDVSMELAVIGSAKTLDELKRLWIGLTPDQRKNQKLIDAKEEQKVKLEQDASGTEDQSEEPVEPTQPTLNKKK
jgi:hypothetical protein